MDGGVTLEVRTFFWNAVITPMSSLTEPRDKSFFMIKKMSCIGT